ncbi:hypothetical protein TEA_007312 [Camellia sinensis var. sinensis]|uniref:EGF-like domain-containing protein n=1 Tax=Camellia sinensis var. sinensis TaxID=542762 RepID=A0A4S4E911_CAMSN|nr:hypothetical protein TEA_007312 [Camellia sinensis var. sinensis]
MVMKIMDEKAISNSDHQRVIHRKIQNLSLESSQTACPYWEESTARPSVHGRRLGYGSIAKSTANAILIVSLFYSHHHASSAATTARDTITTGNPIHDIYGETLISPGNKFQLGFFSTMGESGYVARYIGIWTTVKLLDSGNLVLSDDLSGKVLWQSFDHPTDTFLPGMMMDDNLNLTSWKRGNDPASGNFTFGKDQSNNYIIWQRSKMYWRSGGSGIFNSSDQKLLYKIAPLLSNSSNGKNRTDYGKSLTVSPVLIDNITRLVMSFSGELQLFNWDNGQWSLIWSEPRDKCSVYNACGDFGSCNSENSGVKYCKCLPGFDPNSPDEWNSGEFSSGCTRKTTMCLTDKKYTFLKLKMMKVEDPDSSFEAKSEQDCESECGRLQLPGVFLYRIICAKSH